MMSRIEYFSTRVEQNGDCLLWTAWKNENGYGEIIVKEDGKWKKRRAHRWFYEYLNGKIDKGYCLDHLCGVRSCVEPSHLKVVTLEENNATRYIRDKNRRQCSKGHYYRIDNKIGKCSQCNIKLYLGGTK